jgi:hypothetical protein
MENDTITPESKIKLSVKEFLSVCIFLISIGISIGGFIWVLNDIKDVKGKIDNLSDKLDKIQSQTDKIEGYILNKTK